MAKTYRVTSETVNFSLIMPESATMKDATAEAEQVTRNILQQQAQVIQKDQLLMTVTRVKDHEEEEDGPTMLGRLCADYYRSQSS